MSLVLQPISFREACIFIKEHHRYLKPPAGCKFCVAVNDGEKVVGVAVAGRPIARMLDDGLTLEITRMATDGSHNAISILAGAVRKAAYALGYKKVVTYAMAQENRGESLRAAGYVCKGNAGGGSWSRTKGNRIRVEDPDTLQPKFRWEADAPSSPSSPESHSQQDQFAESNLRRKELRDGEACDHPGCLSHVTHPCEGCGRIMGQTPEQEPNPDRADEMLDEIAQGRVFQP